MNQYLNWVIRILQRALIFSLSFFSFFFLCLISLFRRSIPSHCNLRRCQEKYQWVLFFDEFFIYHTNIICNFLIEFINGWLKRSNKLTLFNIAFNPYVTNTVRQNKLDLAVSILVILVETCVLSSFQRSGLQVLCNSLSNPFIQHFSNMLFQ